MNRRVFLWEAIAILRQIRRLIEKGWTKDAMARDRWSRKVASYSPRAVRWCLIGARINSSIRSGDSAKSMVLAALQNAIRPEKYLDVYNDLQKSKKSVLAIVDRAVEDLKSQLELVKD